MAQLVNGHLAAEAGGDEHEQLASFGILERQQILENPGIYRNAAKAKRPFRLIKVAKLVSIRYAEAVGNPADTAVDDFCCRRISSILGSSRGKTP
jgi:hypothetical protein